MKVIRTGKVVFLKENEEAGIEQIGIVYRVENHGYWTYTRLVRLLNSETVKVIWKK